MKRLLSTRVSENSLSFALLVMRLGFGGLMAVNHGWQKLSNFNQMQAKWDSSVIGLPPTLEVSLVVFAEFFCALFVVIGLFTRLAVIPIIITMAVVFFKVDNANYAKAELPLLFLIGFVALLFSGPGKFSLDRVIIK